MSAPNAKPDALAPTQDWGPGEGPIEEPGLIGRRVGQYRVERLLGRGGMGQVFEAVHESIGQRAAVKVLHRELSHSAVTVRRFLNEARAVSIVQHPGMVKIFDFGQLDDGTLYILMEHLLGESLRDRMDHRGGRLPDADSLRLTRQIASTLQAAHELGIVHRDLKPENVFVVKDPEAPAGERAKLLDFGLAKIFTDPDGPTPGTSIETGAGTIMGTPPYMAPEQCRGLTTVDAKVDVYALGVMLFEMLSGRLPFEAPNMGDLLVQHITEEPPRLRDVMEVVPEGIDELVAAMLVKAPASRLEMREVLATLELLGVKRSSSVPVVAPPSFLRRLQRRARLRAALLIAQLVLLMLTVGAAGLWLLRRGEALRPVAPQAAVLPAPQALAPAPAPTMKPAQTPAQMMEEPAPRPKRDKALRPRDAREPARTMKNKKKGAPDEGTLVVPALR